MAERNEDFLRLLLATDGIEVDLRTRDGDTALCMALLNKPSFEAGASQLLERGAFPNPRYPGDEADTLLHRLTRDGREDSALFLINAPQIKGTFSLDDLKINWMTL